MSISTHNMVKKFWKCIAVLCAMLLVLSCKSEQMDDSIIPEPEDQTFEETFTTEGAPNPNKWWHQINGARMFYLQLDLGHTFSDIEADLDNLYEKGYRIISFYCIYDGEEDAFAGLGPLDFYNPQSSAGSMTDFESLSIAAHQKGMRIMSWINLGYSTYQHSYWIKAQEDVRDGITSIEAASFMWSDTYPGMVDEDELWGWEYSDIAEKFYKKAWGYPGFDWSSEEWQMEASSILEFWHDKGIDGWILDAGEFLEYFNNATPEILRSYIGEVCSNDDVIVASEGSSTLPSWAEERNFLFSYDNTDPEEGSVSHDWENVATLAIQANSAEDIEDHLKAQTDVLKTMGGGTFSYDPEKGEMSESRRPLEIALMTSAGIIYEMYFSRDWDLPPHYGSYTEDMEAVFKAVNTTSALEPGGARTVLENDNLSVYSIVKTSMDRSEKALCVFNFSDTPLTTTVNLNGSGFSTKMKLVNLLNELEELPIDDSVLTIELEEYDFRLYSLINE